MTLLRLIWGLTLRDLGFYQLTSPPETNTLQVFLPQDRKEEFDPLNGSKLYLPICQAFHFSELERSGLQKGPTLTFDLSLF